MTARPPSLAAWLLHRSAPGYDADVMLGDLQEEFAGRAARDGVRAARAWYWRQVRHSLAANLRRRIHSQVPSSETRTMTAITQDLRLAVRALLRRPLYAAVAVLSLSIGIGLSTGVFGVLDAAVMRPLPVQQPSALRVILEQLDKNVRHNFTYPGFDAYRRAQRSIAHVAAYSSAEAAITQPGGSEMVTGELVSGDYFAALAPRMAMGRPLNGDDNVPSAPPVVVLSAFEWRRLFADTAELGGRSIKLNGVDFAVVGVTAAPFRGMQVGRDGRFFAPIVHQPVLAPVGGGRNLLALSTSSWITVIGRLRESVSDEQAIAELAAAGRTLTTTPADRTPRFMLKDGSQGDSMLPNAVAPTLQLLLVASLIVMVVACANVAGLMLARAGDRQRELAVRAALGGGRWRLARMLFCEALVLGLLGTVAGLVVARLVAPIGASLLTQFGQPVTLDVGLNVRVLMMAAGAGLVTALLAGLAPVLRVGPGVRDKRLDIDRVGRLERDLVELVFLEQHVTPVVDLVALDLVLVLDHVAGLGIDRLIADPVAGLAIDDVQAYPARRARRGVHRDRTRDERQLQVAFPGGTGCHDGHSTHMRCHGVERGRLRRGSADMMPDQ